MVSGGERGLWMVWWRKITNMYIKVLSVIEKVPFVPKLVKILTNVIEKVP